MPMQILVSGVPKSGKTTACQYIKEHLKIPYFESKLVGVAYGRNISCVIECGDFEDWPILKSLMETPFHVHIYNEEVEEVLSNITPLYCLSGSHVVPNIVIANSVSNINFIYQLQDLVEILKVKGDFYENFG